MSFGGSLTQDIMFHEFKLVNKSQYHTMPGIGPYDIEACVWRGEARREAGRHGEALEDLDRALRLSRGIYGFLNRALVHAARGRTDAMKSDFRAIPSSIVSHIRARIGLGREGRLEGDPLQAVLRAGLELSRGIRRHERYVWPVWMNGGKA